MQQKRWKELSWFPELNPNRSGLENIMNVKVPELTWVIGEAQDVYPYGFYGTSAALDDAVEGLTKSCEISGTCGS